MDKIAMQEQNLAYDEVARRLKGNYALPTYHYALYNRKDAFKFIAIELKNSVYDGMPDVSAHLAFKLAKINANPRCKWYYSYKTPEIKPVTLNLLHMTED